jgi:hypothetical protein
MTFSIAPDKRLELSANVERSVDRLDVVCRQRCAFVRRANHVPVDFPVALGEFLPKVMRSQQR